MSAIRSHPMRALTREIADASSPVRQFLDSRFASGIRDVQRSFRSAAPALAVPPVPASDANPGTTGGAADWLLRFLVFPHPDARLAMAGAVNLGPRMMRATAEIAELLGATLAPYSGPVRVARPDDAETGAEILAQTSDRTAPTGALPARPASFTGPVAGSTVDAERLARGCWALALLTEAFRSRQAAMLGPLSQLQCSAVSADTLLNLVPPAGLDQLAQLREVFERILIPQLASRTGQWALGPTFAGSKLIGGADADLIAAGLLLDLKTTTKLSLAYTDVLQLIGYTLLDLDDTYRLNAVALFTARYGYFATWELPNLLNELAGRQIDLAATRHEFSELLTVHGASTQAGP